MGNITLENFKVPSTCGECKFIRAYKTGPYARNPHCCCELMWYLIEDDYKVKEDSLDTNCPLRALNQQLTPDIYAIIENNIELVNNHCRYSRYTIGYITGEENADKWIALQKPGRDWLDGHKYPYYTKEKINMLSIPEEENKE